MWQLLSSLTHFNKWHSGNYLPCKEKMEIVNWVQEERSCSEDAVMETAVVRQELMSWKFPRKNLGDEFLRLFKFSDS